MRNLADFGQLALVVERNDDRLVVVAERHTLPATAAGADQVAHARVAIMLDLRAGDGLGHRAVGRARAEHVGAWCGPGLGGAANRGGLCTGGGGEGCRSDESEGEKRTIHFTRLLLGSDEPAHVAALMRL